MFAKYLKEEPEPSSTATDEDYAFNDFHPAYFELAALKRELNQGAPA